jgi:hypothetical protein
MGLTSVRLNEGRSIIVEPINLSGDPVSRTPALSDAP